MNVRLITREIVCEVVKVKIARNKVKQVKKTWLETEVKGREARTQCELSVNQKAEGKY